MLSSHVESRLLSICSALGGYEPDENEVDVFVPGDEAEDCIKDIRRLLKQEDNDKQRPVFSSLGEWDVVENSLVPLLLSPLASPKVVNAILDLLTSLSTESEVIADQLPVHVDALVKLKNALTVNPVMPLVLSTLTTLLSMPYKARAEREHGRIRLLLLLVRNTLAIKPSHTSSTGSVLNNANAKLKEHFILALSACHFFDFLVAFAGSLGDKEYSEWNVVLLEIIQNTLVSVDVKSLGEERQMSSLQTAMAAEVSADIQTRHSRFGGSFAYSSASGKRMVIHQSLASVQNLRASIDSVKKAKNPKVLKTKTERSSYKTYFSPELRRVCRQLVVGVLENGFNTIIKSVKRDIDTDRAFIEDKQISSFFWFCSYFLEARELLSNIEKTQQPPTNTLGLDTVMEMMNKPGFILAFKKIDVYLEDKNKMAELLVVLQGLHQMISTLKAMHVSSNSEFREHSMNLQSNLFYEEAYLKLFQSICRQTKSASMHCLEVVIDNVHMFLSLLANYCKSKNQISIRTKQRVRKTVVDGSEPEEEFRVVEKEITMDRIYAAFLNDGTVDTYIRLLRFYQTLPSHTLLKITTMLHRISIKYEMSAYLYKMSYFELFGRILEHFKTPAADSPELHLTNLIKYIVQRFVKKSQEYPCLFIELFFSKQKADCIRIQSGDLEEYQNSRVKSVVDETREMLVKSSYAYADQIALAILASTDSGFGDQVRWMVTMFDDAIAGRDGKSDDYDDFGILASTGSLVEAFQNERFRLLLRLLKCEKILSESNTTVWVIPSKLDTEVLVNTKDALERYIDAPFQTFGKPIHSYFRNVDTGKKVSKKTAIGIVTSATIVGKYDDVSSEDETVRVPLKKLAKRVVEESVEADLAKSDESEVEVKRVLSKRIIDDEDDE